MNLVPLMLMWMWSNRSTTPQAPVPPQWPTAASPPPPMPAFKSQPTPSAETGTPLAKLHAAPPTPAPAHPAPKPKPKPTPGGAAQAALAAARSGRVPGVKLPGGIRLPGFGLSTTPTKAVLVHDLQGIVNAHGGKLAQDGLYGPKTAAAWKALTQQNGLPTIISRNGPKTAKVSVQAWDALSAPAVP